MQDSTRRQNQLCALLIKPAGPDCNMGCSYCFYRKKAALYPDTAAHRMSFAVMEQIVRQMTALPSPQLSFGWQGGEPTLMGLPFFEQVIDAQIRMGRGKIIGNSLQTNGLLIDDKWAQFLLRYNFLVGLSIDGSKSMHDLHRTDGSDRGSWHSVVQTAKRLVDAGVSVNSMTVVCADNADFAEEIYTFLKALGFHHQQYIPCVEPAPATSHAPDAFSVSPEAFGAFLCRLFDLWAKDFEENIAPVSIRFFESVLNMYLGASPGDCTLLPICGGYLTVEHNGDVFPCDFYVSQDKHLGNVMQGSLAEMFASKAMRGFGNAKRLLPSDCLDCPWRPLCNGGCPKDRPYVGGQSKVNFFCRSYRAFFAHAHPTLSAFAARLAQNASVSSVEASPTAAKPPGRNDPCPCGSKKKFKKCCLMTR